MPSRRFSLLAGALLSLAACRASEGPGMVDPGELPATHLAVLEAYGEGGQVWEAERENVRADPELLRFMIDNLVVEMVRAHDSLSSADPSRARRALDRARAELVRYAPQSTEVLVELFAVGDGVVAKLCAETLTEIGDGVAVLVAPILDREDPRDRRRACVLLRLLPHAGRDEFVIASRLARLVGSDGDWFVRAEASRSLGVRAGKGRTLGPARQVLQAALADPDPAVAEYAAIGLGELGDPLAIPALTGALERGAGEGELKLLHAAQAALQTVSGVRRELDVAGWRAWWREHRADLERGSG